MPHSSGGGSFSGGSHSSSFSSHHSSSSGHSGPPPKTISSRPYPGASHYYYYNRRGRICHFYYDGVPARPSRAANIVLAIFCILFALLLCMVMLSDAWFTPEKLELYSYQSDIVVNDELGLLNRATLDPALEQFRSTTGVTPAIITVYESTWRKDNPSLDRFAYREYLRLFDDEKHWLFVFSMPDNFRSSMHVDWAWEGMAGDDIGWAINEASENRMTDLLQKKLAASTPDMAGEAIAAAFTEFTATAMEPQFDTEALAVVVCIAIIALGVILLLFANYRKNSQYASAQLYTEGVPVVAPRSGGEIVRPVVQPQAAPVSASVPTAAAAPVSAGRRFCPECGTAYVPGTASFCANCGKPLPTAPSSDQSTSF